MEIPLDTPCLTKKHVELMILESAQEHAINSLRLFIREQMHLDKKIIDQRNAITQQDATIQDLRRALGIIK